MILFEFVKNKFIKATHYRVFFVLAFLVVSFVSKAQNTLDRIGFTTNQTAVGAFSLRRVSNSYTGKLIQVRRSSDNNTSDIGYDANGYLDITALQTFVGSGDGYVTIWYDQSGNGNNASQTTPSLQPRIMLAGNIEKLNLTQTVPALKFSGSQYLVITNSTSVLGIMIQNFEFNAVAAPLTTLPEFIFASWGSGSREKYEMHTGYFANNGVRFIVYNAKFADAVNGQPFNGSGVVIAGGRFNGTTAIGRKDGVDGLPISTAHNNADLQLVIGYRQSDADGFKGHIPEALVFAGNINNDRLSLEANQLNYYYPFTVINAHIQSDNANTSLAKVGNTITLNFTATRTIQTPTITIAGEVATVTNTSGNTWQGTITAGANTTEGVAAINVSFADLAGNTGTITSTTDASTVTIDRTNPTLSNVHIQSDYTNTSIATVGSNVTVSFTANEAIPPPTISIAGTNAIVTNTSGNNWQGRITVGGATTDGIASLNISFADILGNFGTLTSTTDGSTVNIDKSVFALTNAHIQSNNSNTAFAKSGDIITLSFTANEAIQTPTITIAGATATLTNTSGNNWRGTITVDGSTTEGIAALNISCTSISGKPGTLTATTDASSVTIDRTTPTLSNVHIQSNNSNTAFAKSGDVITLSFTASEAIQTPTISIAGTNAIVTNTSGNNWQGRITVGGATTQGVAAINISFRDPAGNSGTLTATTDASSVITDGSVPTLSNVHIQSNNSNTAIAQMGDQVTLSFTASEAILVPTVLISGHTATATNTSGNNWQASITVGNSTQQGVAVVNILYADPGGNVGSVTQTSDGTIVIIGTLPSITTFTPAKGLTGSQGSTIVTITGTGFSTVAANNIVFFGPVSAPALTANGTGTSLTVKAPAGAASQYLGVLNTETGLTAQAYKQPFIPGFYNEGNLKFSATADFSQNYTPVGSGKYFKTADIDGDGRPDLILINASNALSIVLNTSANGTVSFDVNNLTTITVGSTIESIAIGDMNGDGKQDIVVMNKSGANHNIFIYPNTSTTGSVSFGTPLTIFSTATTISTFEISLTDIDGDGKTDIVLPSSTDVASAIIRLLLNKYTKLGGFQFQIIVFGSLTSAIVDSKGFVRGDLDGDGKIDLVLITCATESSISKNNLAFPFRNTSTPGKPNMLYSGVLNGQVLGTGFEYPLGQLHSVFAAAGDMDGDGKPDFVSANVAGDGSGSITTLRNQSSTGTISYLPRASVLFNTTPPGCIAMGDFDGDGKLDVATTIEASNEVYIFRNNSLTGNIRFGAKFIFPTATNSPQYLEFCDLNGDGIPDMITANHTGLAVQKGLPKVKFVQNKIPF